MIEFFAASFDITADLFSGSKEGKGRGPREGEEINVDRFVSREECYNSGKRNHDWMPLALALR